MWITHTYLWNTWVTFDLIYLVQIFNWTILTFLHFPLNCWVFLESIENMFSNLKHLVKRSKEFQILFYLHPCMNKLQLNGDWSKYMWFDFFLIQTKQNHIIFPFFSCQFNHGINMCEESAGRVHVLTWHYGSCHYGHRWQCSVCYYKHSFIRGSLLASSCTVCLTG